MMATVRDSPSWAIRSVFEGTEIKRRLVFFGYHELSALFFEYLDGLELPDPLTREIDSDLRTRETPDTAVDQTLGENRSDFR